MHKSSEKRSFDQPHEKLTKKYFDLLCAYPKKTSVTNLDGTL